MLLKWASATWSGCSVLVAGEVDQRPEVVVPRVHEREDRDRHDHRPGLRQDDRAQDPERAGAVDHRRLVVVARDREQVLPQ